MELISFTLVAFKYLMFAVLHFVVMLLFIFSSFAVFLVVPSKASEYSF